MNVLNVTIDNSWPIIKSEKSKIKNLNTWVRQESTQYDPFSLVNSASPRHGEV